MNLKLSDFNYELPRELIATYPPKDRPSARLLCVDRQTGQSSHYVFRDILHFLRPGDLLVLNNTRVLAARIFGTRETGGKVEALLLKQIEEHRWEALLRPGGRIKAGARITFGENGTRLQARVLDGLRPNSGQRRIEFQDDEVREKLEKIGHIPLPPYIDRPDAAIDRELYQTVFAEKEGAVASPTAGLHFDESLLEALRQKGIEIAYVTLHTGYGTFQSLSEEDLSRQTLHAEEFEITEKAAEQINRARAEGRRVIACGTTSVRAIESAVTTLHSALSPRGERKRVRAQSGETNLFIYPPYEFKGLSGLITNFHLPKSSLLLLVAAFLGLEKMRTVYEEALRKKYRFYSYGDAMLIL
ncbi:MAG: tRNA preQ1(34) S-adenosylmethionine ribosyltransferase-isomerase QueA [Candidatus Omnitrophica bacterium]|nr:tRNA preQ1(34) S-adenosylmethionine ribosyltransferase-isomerase QueA [Candidatus Omnitrophota bacterium]